MVQGNNSLEVNSKSQLDDCASSSGNDYVDADTLNEELSIVSEKLLEKYNCFDFKRIGFSFKTKYFFKKRF